CQQHNSRPWTF
nr:immunoglobulin light chain junction region [Macaca mulatta]